MLFNHTTPPAERINPYLTAEEMERNATTGHKRKQLEGAVAKDRNEVTRWLSRADVFRIRTTSEYYLADEEHKQPIHHKRRQTKPRGVASVTPITM